jgi:hypothetical protein
MGNADQDMLVMHRVVRCRSEAGREMDQSRRDLDGPKCDTKDETATESFVLESTVCLFE